MILEQEIVILIGHAHAIYFANLCNFLSSFNKGRHFISKYVVSIFLFLLWLLIKLMLPLSHSIFFNVLLPPPSLHPYISQCFLSFIFTPLPSSVLSLLYISISLLIPPYFNLPRNIHLLSLLQFFVVLL